MPEEIASNHINLSSDEKLVQTPPEQQSQVLAPCRLPRHVRMHFECLADEGANQTKVAARERRSKTEAILATGENVSE
jgi:hypothetical protein